MEVRDELLQNAVKSCDLIVGYALAVLPDDDFRRVHEVMAKVKYCENRYRAKEFLRDDWPMINSLIEEIKQKLDERIPD